MAGTARRRTATAPHPLSLAPPNGGGDGQGRRGSVEDEEWRPIEVTRVVSGSLVRSMRVCPGAVQGCYPRLGWPASSGHDGTLGRRHLTACPFPAPTPVPQGGNAGDRHARGSTALGTSAGSWGWCAVGEMALSGGVVPLGGVPRPQAARRDSRLPRMCAGRDEGRRALRVGRYGHCVPLWIGVTCQGATDTFNRQVSAGPGARCFPGLPEPVALMRRPSICIWKENGGDQAASSQ